jgi:subtilase family serine protease
MTQSKVVRRLKPAVAFLMFPLLGTLPMTAAVASTAHLIPSPVATIQKLAPAPSLPRGTLSLGALTDSTRLSGAVTLAPRDEAALTSFIGAATNKNSPLYHRYLVPGAFKSRFGPTASTITAVERAVGADGLSVTGVASDGLLVDFSGTAAQAETTFHTGLVNYRLANGHLGRATTSTVELSLPQTVARSVTGVIGLDNLIQQRPADVVPHATSASSHATEPASVHAHVTGAPSACTAAQLDATESGGLTDDQIANSYGATGLYQAGDFGSGQHVAVYELEPFSASDIEGFDTCYFGATKAAQMSGTDGNNAGSLLSVVPVDGGQLPGQGSDESLLDIEDVSAMAPEANIDVYEAPNTSFGGLDEYASIVNSDADQIVTSSWGECEQLEQDDEPGIQQAENFLFQQAAAQGQTVLAAAGDTGDDSCNESRDVEPPAGQNFLSQLDPASQPYVVSVGGLTINNATQPPSEQVWNDGAQWGAGGGGISESWTMPSWQQPLALNAANSTDVANAESFESATASENAPFATPTFCDGTLGLAPTTPCREVPDVSAQADEFTGSVTIYGADLGYGFADGWATIGGTSSATPIWAAMLALVNGSAGCAADLVNGVPDAGFASPLLYSVAATPAAYAASFTDVTSGNNDIDGFDNGESFEARTGYDMASGLGSPELTSPSGGIGLAFYMCSLGSSNATSVVHSLSPTFGSTAGGEELTVTGSGFGSTGSPDVASVQVGTGRATSFTVVNSHTLLVTVPAATTTTPPSSPDPTQDGAGPANVVVTFTNGQSTSPSATSIFEYVDESVSQSLPSVTSVSPYGGLDTNPATVTVFGSGFGTCPLVNSQGLCPGQVTSLVEHVDFGGAPATNVTVISPFELTVSPPAFSSLTPATACPMDNGATGQPLNPAEDVCQAQVTVTTSVGTSATATILPPFEGEASFDAMDGIVLPSGCGCEDEPQTTEYDYVPAPTITSVSTGTAADLPGNAESLASEFGGSASNIVEVTGTGMDPLTMDFALFGGPPYNENSVFYPIEANGTSMIIDAPAISYGNASTEPVSVPVGVTSLAGTTANTAVAAVEYAGIPEVDAVTNTANTRTISGVGGVPDTGGSPLSIAGAGLSQSAGPLGFVDNVTGTSLGTQYTYNVASDSAISTESVAQNPGFVDLEVCSTTGCSIPSSVFGSPADLLLVYPPGAPKVTSVTPNTGSPEGGTSVVIQGTNLGCAVAVNFGNSQAENFENSPASLDCGATGAVDVSSPLGVPGSTEPVVVTTAASYFTNTTPTSSAAFSYTGAVGSPVITSADALNVQSGHSFSIAIKSQGSGKIALREFGALPSGVYFRNTSNGRGLIEGQPHSNTGGVYDLTLRATNSLGQVKQSFILTDFEAPIITTRPTWVIRTGAPAAFTMTTIAYPLAFDYLIGTLPAGMSAESNGANGTLVISGTPQPASAGTYTVQLVAQNEFGTAHRDLTITVK